MYMLHQPDIGKSIIVKAVIGVIIVESAAGLVMLAT
jgi:hypothetical protein